MASITRQQDHMSCGADKQNSSGTAKKPQTSGDADQKHRLLGLLGITLEEFQQHRLGDALQHCFHNLLVLPHFGILVEYDVGTSDTRTRQQQLLLQHHSLAPLYVVHLVPGRRSGTRTPLERFCAVLRPLLRAGLDGRLPPELHASDLCVVTYRV